MDDFHFAQVVQSIAETNRNPKKRGSSYKIGDFLPKWDDPNRRPHKATTVEGMLRLLEGFEEDWKARNVQRDEEEFPPGTIIDPNTGRPVGEN